MDKTEFLKMLHIAEKLKDTPRHCTTSNRRTESVAEHSWRVALMALLLRSEFHSVDIDKVVAMCLIHDMGELPPGKFRSAYPTISRPSKALAKSSSPQAKT